MTNIHKLKFLCIKKIIEFDIELNPTEVPIELRQHVMKSKTLSGQFASEDKLDIIVGIKINYETNDETLNLDFKIGRNFHAIKLTKNGKNFLSNNILYSISSEQISDTCYDIFHKGSITVIYIGYEDVQWKWQLWLEVG